MAWLDQYALLYQASSLTGVIKCIVTHVRKEFSCMGDTERAVDLAGQIARSPDTEDALAIFQAGATLQQQLVDGVVDRVRKAICT